MKIDLENITKGHWLEYIEICGWTLARAHARTGDAAMIGGYLGETIHSIRLSRNLRLPTLTKPTATMPPLWKRFARDD
jgi:Uncharacterized protein conserved in bacteria (DUF2252)